MDNDKGGQCSHGCLQVGATVTEVGSKGQVDNMFHEGRTVPIRRR